MKKHWRTLEQGASTNSQVVVPIYEGADAWGQVELTFEPLFSFALVWAVFTSRFFTARFYFIYQFHRVLFFLGKMLKQLDPSQAIPDRVRTALDTMAEGLLVIDSKQNIVLSNLAFSSLSNEPAESLMGRRIERLSLAQ